ncbi:hypothetical protein cand_034420 [Cryptosporidium andersoni]|uniref:Uncharacterized protein n=1 Tax=Cryptosporidium andersoni TaxID=117008 RepID=A0A1J4MVC2_9CRYT|nr:hypothetical protein cand_034420 [Cryptosporidium andersoni]
MVLFQWQSEYEYLLHKICDMLDECKQLGFLMISTDYANAYLNTSAFQNYVSIGSNALREDIRRIAELISSFSTPGILSYMSACCVDDINLSHIFSLLRLHTLLEHYPKPLILHTQRAQIVIAMYGELSAVRRDLETGILKRQNDNNNLLLTRKYNNEQCIELLKKTINQFTGIIVDSGRDRSTYIKEAFCAPAFTPPRTNIAIPIDNDLQLSDNLNGQMNHSISLIPCSNKGDPLLVTALLCGSTLSIWQRLYLLYDPDRETSKESIVHAVAYAAPKMDRMRQLVFTSFLQALCRPKWNEDNTLKLSNKMKRNQNQNTEIIQLVVRGFLSSGISVWSYEYPQQVHDITSSHALSIREKNKLLSILKLLDEKPLIDDEIDESNIIPSFESVIRELAREFYHNSNWEIEDTGFLSALGERKSFNDKGNVLDGALKTSYYQENFHGKPLDSIVSDRSKFYHAMGYFKSTLTDSLEGVYTKSDYIVSADPTFFEFQSSQV